VLHPDLGSLALNETSKCLQNDELVNPERMMSSEDYRKLCSLKLNFLVSSVVAVILLGVKIDLSDASHS
jgi:acetamidase/formamidase